MNDNCQPLVSIGIPTYNRADSYLGEALRSAMAQIYPAVQIIVADNGSTDKTESFVKGLADQRVQYYRHSPGLDPNDNFNFCLEKAEGKYFLLLHDDDIIDPDFVEVCMAAARTADSVGIIRSGVRTIDADGQEMRVYPNREGGLSSIEFVRKWLHSQSMLILCSTLFNTKLLKDMGGFGSRHNLFQDVAAELQLASRYGRIDVKDVKASFRKHGGQRTSTSQINAWREDSEELLETICDLFPEEKESLRSLGNVHFSKHNYELASGIGRIAERYASYARIYRGFDRELSPIRFFYDKAHGTVFTRLGIIKRRLLAVAGLAEARDQ